MLKKMLDSDNGSTLLLQNEIEEFQNVCRYGTDFDYWTSYVSLMNDNYKHDLELYAQIEDELIQWVQNNLESRVYYAGDLVFYFETTKDRDLFDLEFGDTVAFKLRWA